MRRAVGKAAPRRDSGDDEGCKQDRHQTENDADTHMAPTPMLSSFGNQILARRRVSHVNRSFHGATISIIMFHVKVDRDEDLALHDQVAAEIRRAIADGEAGPGERLPPAKDLAAVLEVNSNTVLRALRLLRDEGLLEFRRGRGVTVAGTPEQGAVLSRARELVDFARRHGYRREEVIEMIAGLP